MGGAADRRDSGDGAPHAVGNTRGGAVAPLLAHVGVASLRGRPRAPGGQMAARTARLDVRLTAGEAARLREVAASPERL